MYPKPQLRDAGQWSTYGCSGSRSTRKATLSAPRSVPDGHNPALTVLYVPFSLDSEQGFRIQGSGFRVQGSGFRVQGSGFRVDRGNIELIIER